MATTMVSAVCGIGGGVVIKPVWDAIEFMPVAAVSFLSGITVLCISSYTVVASAVKREFHDFPKAIWFLSFGAAAGGRLGKMLFEEIK